VRLCETIAGILKIKALNREMLAPTTLTLELFDVETLERKPAVSQGRVADSLSQIMPECDD
jgi:hypothetical protein